jgi:hypothetical protein
VVKFDHPYFFFGGEVGEWVIFYTLGNFHGGIRDTLQKKGIDLPMTYEKLHNRGEP